MNQGTGRGTGTPPRDPTPPILKAAALALAAAVLFTAEVVFVKLLANTVPVTTIMLARSAGQIVYVAPLLLQRGVILLRTARPLLHVARGSFSLICWGLYYWSFQRLDLATATVLSFTSVMFVTALAGPILGEIVRWRRWTATIVGFLGVVLVAKPFDLRIDPAIGIALLSALFGSGIVLTTKKLSATERTETILLYIGFVTFGGSLPVALPNLAVPEPWQAFWLVLMGVTGPAGMHLWINAFRLADATVVSPLGYTRLIFSAIVGVVLFNETPDLWMVCGAVLIVGSAIYITLREVKVARSGR
jgi:drug/metabolite transporter (DMT)-like permease